jgi:integrase
MKLTAIKVRGLRAPGKYLDGQGLYLRVTTAERRAWVFRYMLQGKAREMSLGNADEVTLAEARAKHQDARKLIRDGVDPLDARRAGTRKPEPVQTFASAAETYIAAHAPGWKHPKHRQGWTNTLANYAYPVIGAKPVGEIDVNDILAVLTPVWAEKTELASRLRGRMETVLTYAKTRGWRAGENPAAWRDNLKLLLPSKAKVHQVEHHPALPWQEAPQFMARVVEDHGMGSRALQFAILTACRSGEVRGARWDEIDLQAGLWCVPSRRTKTGKPHRVPLSDAACELLRPLADIRMGSLVFFGRDGETPLSDMTLIAVLRRMDRHDLTVHGFRSTFRDWCADNGVAHDVAEAALAHVTGSGTVQAYLRSDLLEARRGLMREWAEYLAREAAQVVALPTAA